MADAAQLAIFRGRQTVVKRKLTLLETFLSEFDPQQNTIQDVYTRLEGLSKIKLDVDALYDAWTIFVVDLDEDLKDVGDEADKIEQRYYEIKSRLSKFLGDLKISDQKPNVVANENLGCDNRRDPPRVRLPDIQLPKFDGSLDKWITFRDIFQAMIIDTDSIPSVQKFVYLNSCLLGEAKKLVDKIPLSENGFNLAWTALTDRYNHKKMIIFKHISQLFATNVVGKDSLSDLRALTDDCRLHYRALENLNLPVESWDMVLVYFIIQRLDDETRKLWENESKDDDDVTFDGLMEFLNGRCIVLQSISDAPSKQKLVAKTSSSKSSSRTFMTSHEDIVQCKMCSAHHSLSVCQKFLSLKPTERYEKVKQFGLCLNCLSVSHSVNKCTHRPCKICRYNHSDLLHFTRKNTDDVKEGSSDQSSSSKDPRQPKSSSSTDHTLSLSCQNSSPNHVILPTAVILVADRDGTFHECRTLLDSGSQSNLMTKELADKLKLNAEVTTSTVFGLNNLAVTIRKKVNSKIKSRVKEFGKELQFCVVPEITSCLPNSAFDVSHWNWRKTLQLADQSFNVPSKIDVILGAEVFFEVLQPKRYPMSPGSALLQETKFGFVASGVLDQTGPSKCFFLSNVIVDEENLDRQVRSFWEIESCETKQKVVTVEEKLAEKIFESTVSRNDSGRYVVTIPFKESYHQLGESRIQALKRFGYLETKLSKNPELKQSYIEFMREYESLGHMSVCRNSHLPNAEYFLPHHAVLRPESTTTKLRVVFDGSACSSSGLSINDVMIVGPQLQDDLFDLVLRFRRYAVVFTADIVKMYRQILICPSHLSYQKVFWREDPSQSLKEYQLETVTYGTSSAPYLATKVLQQIAKDVESTLPLASRVIKNDFYMDDLLSGSDTVDEALEIISQTNIALEAAGMTLRKWSSNNSSVLSQIDPENISSSSSSDGQKVIKTLGLRWDPESDVFSFDVKSVDQVQHVTKRTVLSDVAKIFDPLGLLAPVVINAKIFIQSLWLQKLEWDEELPSSLCEKWITFRGNLIDLNNVILSRSIFANIDRTMNVEIHGFADASQSAYGACVYVRFESSSGEIFTNLLCSKSRVAPLKTTTIPRLELNAALLLAKLVHRVNGIMPDLFRRVFLWTDSSIVLSWLKLNPHNLKLYVANRTAEIQELTSKFTWRHVNSKSNSADVLSRGIDPSDLGNCTIWWHGPEFLKSPDSQWPQKFIDVETSKLPEIKNPDLSLSFVATIPEDIFNITYYDSLIRLSRIVAYALRFIRHCKERIAEVKERGIENRNLIRAEKKRCRCLNAAEVVDATKVLVKIVQNQEFSSDLRHLTKFNCLPEKSKLTSLSPFVDDEGLLRVGGRLHNSSLSYDQKHQMLLPKHHFSSLIIDFHHTQNLHAGVQSTLSSIRQRYWLIDGKNSTKKIIRQCLKCFIHQPKRLEQFMGSLPSSRTEICRPFNTTGVDFCGPFYTRYKPQRKDSVNKTYVCIFICFVTKGIHLECIEDLTSTAFIDGLKRFIARRGNVSTIWSDNGTNFLGARNEMDRFQKMMFGDNKIVDFVTTKGIEWKFIPPRSPHFGGIWESAVRMFKLHFKKVVGSTVLTIELFWSLVIQIEGILNSRPLTPLSTDPTDLEPLTPAHFLTGGPINAIIEPDLTTVPENRVKYWEKTRQMSQLFWKRFSLEYFHTLQERQKWTKSSPNLKCGDVVLVVEDNQPSSKWLMGVIVKVIEGKDNKVRVAVARTKYGEVKRSITKFAKLPFD